MKIYTDSWHYKYVASKWTTNPEALCWYFWKIVLTMLVFTALGIGACVVAIAALFFLTFPLWQWFFDYDLDMMVGVFLLWFFVGAVVFAKYRIYLYDSGQLKRKVKVYKEPGLVSEYLHAKHRKVCPLLTYEYREKPE